MLEVIKGVKNYLRIIICHHGIHLVDKLAESNQEIVYQLLVSSRDKSFLWVALPGPIKPYAGVNG